jgi:hypothetical protein
MSPCTTRQYRGQQGLQIWHRVCTHLFYHTQAYTFEIECYITVQHNEHIGRVCMTALHWPNEPLRTRLRAAYNCISRDVQQLATLLMNENRRPQASPTLPPAVLKRCRIVLTCSAKTAMTISAALLWSLLLLALPLCGICVKKTVSGALGGNRVAASTGFAPSAKASQDKAHLLNQAVQHLLSLLAKVHSYHLGLHCAANRSRSTASLRVKFTRPRRLIHGSN